MQLHTGAVQTDTVTESALKADSGRKKFLLHWGLEPASALLLAFESSMPYSVALACEETMAISLWGFHAEY